jgi:hypothetical protein
MNMNLVLLNIYFKIQNFQHKGYETQAVSEDKQEKGRLHIIYIQRAVLL